MHLRKRVKAGKGGSSRPCPTPGQGGSKRVSDAKSPEPGLAGQSGSPPTGVVTRLTRMPEPGGGSGPRAAMQSIAVDLTILSRRVQRLAPSHRDPEAFHAEKSEIEHELRRMAIAMRGRSDCHGDCP